LRRSEDDLKGSHAQKVPWKSTQTGAFSIFILRRNPELELLIQKRALTKYHSGGLWTNSCCGHPRPSETLIEAATRRLKEEIGLSLSLPLKEIGV